MFLDPITLFVACNVPGLRCRNKKGGSPLGINTKFGNRVSMLHALGVITDDAYLEPDTHGAPCALAATASTVRMGLDAMEV